MYISEIFNLKATAVCNYFSVKEQQLCNGSSVYITCTCRHVHVTLPTAAAPHACRSVSNSAIFSHVSRRWLYLSMSRRLAAVVKSVPWVLVAPPHRNRSPPTATREAWHRGIRISAKRTHLKHLKKDSMKYFQ